MSELLQIWKPGEAGKLSKVTPVSETETESETHTPAHTFQLPQHHVCTSSFIKLCNRISQSSQLRDPTNST